MKVSQGNYIDAVLEMPSIICATFRVTLNRIRVLAIYLVGVMFTLTHKRIANKHMRLSHLHLLGITSISNHSMAITTVP